MKSSMVEQRHAVARDVLEHMGKDFQPTSGIYLRTVDGGPPVGCYACALGAAWLAQMHQFGTFRGSKDRRMLLPELLPLWDAGQLQQMERLFESNYGEDESLRMRAVFQTVLEDEEGCFDYQHAVACLKVLLAEAEAS